VRGDYKKEVREIRMISVLQSVFYFEFLSSTKRLERQNSSSFFFRGASRFVCLALIMLFNSSCIWNGKISAFHIRPYSEILPRLQSLSSDDADKLAIMYLYTIQFDRCGDAKTAQAYRKILENYFHTCFKTDADENSTFLSAQEQLIKLDRDLKNRRTHTLKQDLDSLDWVAPCSDFDSEESTLEIINFVKLEDDLDAAGSSPNQCERWSFISNDLMQ
jgi:hypothetical protein